MAAFTSRSRTELQPLQVHSRSFRVSSLLIEPQLEQVFDDGANCPILRMFLPCQSALYSNIVTKVDQPASDIACAKLWFLTMFLTAKVSSAIVWFSLINLLESFCKKSLRLFATFSFSFANFNFVFSPLCFEYLRCMYLSLLCAFLRYLGLSKTSPSEVIAKSFIPRSIPIVLFSATLGLMGKSSCVSQSIETKYLPVGVKETVALFILPSIFLWNFTLIPSLNLGIFSLPLSILTCCGTEKLPLLVLLLNLGKPAPF